MIRLRATTAALHERLEERLDIVARLAEPGPRSEMIRRFAAFHLTGEAALRHHLAPLPGLDFGGRSRASWLAMAVPSLHTPPFPIPRSTAEALGMFYVIEGSMLGGRVILRALADRGISDPALGLLDPYGAETGRRWRDFLAVLAREISSDEDHIAAACQGACSGFMHAEQVLCEGSA
jgi:heme oxygenase (biliverdin-IX-beta and delta-forming)